MLFQYIEKCERIEKQQKLAKLSAHVAKQRKLLDEQTIKLNLKMKNQKKRDQKKKIDALAEVHTYCQALRNLIAI